jgi:2-C-methyl-D-erythritol 2,4-cyclodiphosphate synthase
MKIRVGLGHDSHRLQSRGPLRLGGIDIPFDKSAVGHSDADVLLHAITDALLGAAALGDIGQLFPDQDPANRGKDSAEMLAVARDRVLAAGWRIGNLDCVVLAERPKILPYREAIVERLASVLGIEPGDVSLKGKTGEGVGEIGRGELIQAMCVCLLTRPAS